MCFNGTLRKLQKNQRTFVNTSQWFNIKPVSSLFHILNHWFDRPFSRDARFYTATGSITQHIDNT